MSATRDHERAVFERAQDVTAHALASAREPTDECCREDRLWRVYSRIHEPTSWGLVEGKLRMRWRMKAISVRLVERDGYLDMRVLPREPIRSISCTIDFANPEVG